MIRIVFLVAITVLLSRFPGRRYQRISKGKKGNQYLRQYINKRKL